MYLISPYNIYEKQSIPYLFEMILCCYYTYVYYVFLFGCLKKLNSNHFVIFIRFSKLVYPEQPYIF